MLKFCDIKIILKYIVPLIFKILYRTKLEETDLMSKLKYATYKSVLFVEGKILFSF